MNQELMDLLPWYVNGTLTSDEKKFVEQHLDDSPAYRQQLDFLAAMQQEVQHGVPETAADLGLAVTLNKIKAHSNTERAKVSDGTSLQRWLAKLFGGGFELRPVYALGTAVIALQAVTISYLFLDNDKSYSEMRAKQIVPASVGPFIKVSFVPDAKESDIRFLMIQLGSSIVGGPSQLGDYYLFLKPSRIDWAAQQLRKSPFVDSVNVIATLPVAKE